MGPVDSAADKARAPDEWAANEEPFRTTDQESVDRRDGSTSPDDLRQRIDGLPPGHPSSPYEADGTRRQPIPRLRDLETLDEDEPADKDWQPTDSNEGADSRPTHENPIASPDRQPCDAGADVPPDPDAPRSTDELRPLTDAEWTEHVTEVRDNLEDATESGFATDLTYTVDQERTEWASDRNRVQGALIADLYEQARHVPCDGLAIIAGGLAGAGKSTILGKHAGIDLSQYLTINPDNIKEEMARRGLIPKVEGLSPMEASELAHEESSYIAKRLALRATADEKNIIWDITMSTLKSTEERIDNLRSAGYAIGGIFVDIPVDVSVRRADARHREAHDAFRAGIGHGGRYVPHEIIEAQADPDWGSKNRKTFEEVNHLFDHWSRYDNSVDGRPPVLVQTDLPDDTNREEKA